MVKICGKLVNTYNDKTKNGKQYNVYQVLITGNRSNVINIKDYENRVNGYKVGSDVEIPVFQKAWHSNGKLGIDNILIGEK